MNITEVIIAAGSTMEAVYYYEHIQLIEPARENNQRIYSNQDSGNIRFIERMLRLGLTPEELHVIFEIKRTHQCTTPDKAVRLSEKLKTLHIELCLRGGSFEMQQLEVEGLLEVLKFFKSQADCSCVDR